MTYDQIRCLTLRYVRRASLHVPTLDSLRLARRLERRVPQDRRGPTARAILQFIVIDAAAFYGVPATS